MTVASAADEQSDEQTARLFDAAVEVAQSLSGPAVIVDQCTASPVIADRVARLMARNSSHELVVVSQPPRRALRVFFNTLLA